MTDYRITPLHRRGMPKLLEWCDEAAIVHWNQEAAEAPDSITAETPWPVKIRTGSRIAGTAARILSTSCSD